MRVIPPYAPSFQDWARQASSALTDRINGYPFPELDTAPDSVSPGYTYFDSALNVVRTWDGASWQNHW